MHSDAFQLSDDQAEAFDAVADLLASSGVDLVSSELSSKAPKPKTIAVVGRAGSGKTALLAQLVDDIVTAGVQIAAADYEPKRLRKERSLAILAPTNKAASVLRQRGVPATTLHRILYRPVYDPEYEQIAKWLTEGGEEPDIEGLTESVLAQVKTYYEQTKSVIGALSAVGIKGSDFITGWKRREEPLDIGFVDEASMLEHRHLEDLQEIFTSLVLFGDPAQLPPVQQSGELLIDTLPSDDTHTLTRIHRQTHDNPILDLAHDLFDPDMDFYSFEDRLQDLARHDERIAIAERVDADLLARSPVLVWRNNTRIRLINAYRQTIDAPAEMLLPGEPLICDGLELDARHRNKRQDFEARGLVRGTQAVYLGESKKNGFARLYLVGAEDPRISVASIVKIEQPDDAPPTMPMAARQGAVFLHGAAITIHKAQGGQWPAVQVFAPDLMAAARAGRIEAGLPMWKRLAYVAITRAQEQLIWVTRYRISRLKAPLTTLDLLQTQDKLTLS